MRPSAKKADSKFSRKLTPWKSAVALSEMLAGGGPLGGAPPAVLASSAESTACAGATGAARTIEVRARSPKEAMDVVCMAAWI